MVHTGYLGSNPIQYNQSHGRGEAALSQRLESNSVQFTKSYCLIIVCDARAKWWWQCQRCKVPCLKHEFNQERWEVRDIPGKGTACVKRLLESRVPRRTKCSFQCDCEREWGLLNGMKESRLLYREAGSDHSSSKSHVKDFKFLPYGTLEAIEVS